MSIIQESFSKLYPNKELNYNIKLKYSRRFNDFNANVRMQYNDLEFNLSRKWKNIDDEIKIGLLQSLLNKIFKTKIKTNNIELYNIFIKKLHLAVPKTKTDPILEDSFNRINEKYFYGIIEKPNLVWGNKSVAQLGTYDYHTDTIKISLIFKEHIELLDYIMYHEMLHKKYKFTSKNNRTYHHTKEFKKKEREFDNAKEMERLIRVVTTRKRIK